MAIQLATSPPTQSTGELRLGETPQPTTYTAVVIFDGDRWVALCRELDIAAEGSDRDEAYRNLRAAVLEALAVARDKGISAGERVPDPDLVDFMRSHQAGPQRLPVSTYSFTAD